MLKGIPRDRPAAESDDDGPNPLPPAIETGAVKTTRPPTLVEENLMRTAQNESDGSSPSGRQANLAVLESSDPNNGLDQQRPEQAPQPIPAGILAIDGSDPGDSAKTQRRQTWRELGEEQADVPLDESLKRAATQRHKPIVGSSLSRMPPPIDRPGLAYSGFWAARRRNSTRPSSRARAASIPPSAD